VEQLILATRNAHKTREFGEMLGDQFSVRDLSEHPELTAIEETGTTFAENAILKAVGISRHVSGMVVADDSGLEVDVLNGAPGVYSARYAGPNASDADNVERLLREVEPHRGVRPIRARFQCVLALAEEGKLVKTFHGAVEGTIVAGPRGGSGFGYDPVFQPTGYDKTFAEMSPAEKNTLSHRAKAVYAMRADLRRR
jgi:XTP/dITP diphosphohydrolase